MLGARARVIIAAGGCKALLTQVKQFSRGAAPSTVEATLGHAALNAVLNLSGHKTAQHEIAKLGIWTLAETWYAAHRARLLGGAQSAEAVRPTLTLILKS